MGSEKATMVGVNKRIF